MPVTLSHSVADVDWVDVEILFQEVQLGGRRGDKLRRAFLNSQLTTFAYDENRRLLGCARAITDWEYHAVIYDVAVRTEHQGTGLGRHIMADILGRLPVWRVMLIADEDVQPFYRRFSFDNYPGAMARLSWDALYDPNES